MARPSKRRSEKEVEALFLELAENLMLASRLIDQTFSVLNELRHRLGVLEPPQVPLPPQDKLDQYLRKTGA